MSDEKKDETKPKPVKKITEVKLRSYPKVIFFYPLLFTSLIVWIIQAATDAIDPKAAPIEGLAYFWIIVAPDIPEEYGGSVPFMAGGWNLSFYTDGQVIAMDGKTTSELKYDPTYHTGKIAMICKHAVGVEIGIQIMFELYKE